MRNFRKLFADHGIAGVRGIVMSGKVYARIVTG